MTNEELLAWGRIENERRQADIAVAKASVDMTAGIKTAKANAEARRKLAGLSMNEAARAVADVQRAERYAAMG